MKTDDECGMMNDEFIQKPVFLFIPHSAFRIHHFFILALDASSSVGFSDTVVRNFPCGAHLSFKMNV
jgi:hypothetical protein